MKKIFFSMIFILILSACFNTNTSNNREGSSSETGKHENNIELNFDIDNVGIPFTIYTQPCINGSNLYIPVNYNHDDLISRIIKLDLEGSNETSSIFESMFEEPTINSLMCNEKWMIWVDQDIFGFSPTIYAKEIKTEETKIISRGSPDHVKIDAPYLYNNMVAWVDIAKNGGLEIVLYHLQTDEKKVITTLNDYGFYNNFVHINDNKLLWTDHKEGNGYYYIYDIINSEISEYEAPSPYPGYAKLMGDKIFSINFNVKTHWTNQEFGYYNMEDSNYYPLIDEGYINQFIVNDSFIVVMNSENELDIYYKNGQKINKADIEFDFLLNYLLTLTEDNLIIINSFIETEEPFSDEVLKRIQIVELSVE